VSKNWLIPSLMVCLILAMIPTSLAQEAVGNDTSNQTNQTAATNVSIDRTTSPPMQAITTEAVQNGLATGYWLTLTPYPDNEPTGLYLLVDGNYKLLQDPDTNIVSSVQQAFAYPNIYEVRVWSSGNNIVGLVVKTK
jgi:hypothetical protein